MIKAISICHSFVSSNETVEVFNETSCGIMPGEFVIVTGRSGGGKSTLLCILGGLLKPCEGRVLIDDTDIYTLDDKRRTKFRAEKFGFVFQSPNLFPTLNVMDNVLMPVALSGRRVSVRDRDMALDLLERMGLKDKVNVSPAKLSGGQQRRVGIARALMLNPPYILADEPTADLDEETEKPILELFQQLNSLGSTILLVTHTADHVNQGNRVLEVKQRRVYEKSSSASDGRG